MKKNILLLVFLLGVFGVSNANEINKNKLTTHKETSRYGYMEPFKFIERGIEFYVFPNGEFDFNTHPEYGATPRRNVSINISYGAPANYYPNNNGVYIEHDHMGRVRRVGNVFINYDAYDRIKRIGSVYMNYRRDLISNIGGLYIYYDRHYRIIRTSGYIKHNLGCHFCGSHRCHSNHYGNPGHAHGHNNHNNWNNNNMYFRGKSSKKKKNKR